MKLPTSLWRFRNAFFLKSSLIHFANVATGVAILVLSVKFFSWDLYGELAIVISTSLIATQICVLGNPNLMLADLSESEIGKFHSIIIKYLKKVVKVQFLIVILFFTFMILTFSFSSFKFVNLSTIGMLAVLGSVFFGPFNKLIFTVLTLPKYFSRLVLISFSRNLFMLAILILGVIFDSSQIALFTIALTEIVLLVITASTLHSFKNNSSDKKDSKPIKSKSARGEKSVFFITIYYELLCKFDVFIYPYFMTPKLFGMYAVISSINESLQTYLSSVRTQITPHYSTKSKRIFDDDRINLRFVRIVMVCLVVLGFIFLILTYRISGESLPNWLVIYACTVVSSLVLFKSLIYGYVFIQKRQYGWLARTAMLHLFFLYSTTAFLFYFLGVIFGILAAVAVNIFFSRLIWQKLSKEIVYI